MQRWKPKEKRIFRWHDGGKARASDPLAVDRALNEHLPELRDLIGQLRLHYSAIETNMASITANTPNGQAVLDDVRRKAEAAVGDLAAGIRKVFGLNAVSDEQGEEGANDAGVMDDANCVELLLAFMNYKRELAEGARPLASAPVGPTSPASVTPSSVGSTSADTPGT